MLFQIILKDKLNPYREELCVFESRDVIQVKKFITSLRSNLLNDHWKIKAKIIG